MKIAPNLTLDADYVGGGTFALLAKKGAGKTYTGRVLAEEMWKAKVPFVALDPMDAWWGLRSSADGEKEGIPVAVFGGPHGDAPLERTGGKLMADLVVDEGLSMILSLKHFGSRAAERQFALDFLERLYRRNSELVHLLIDEADLFAPQSKRDKGDMPLLGVTENIVRRGRNSGIGVTLITQRPAVLNKDVLTQVDGLCVMRMLGPQDRDAIDDWVGSHGDTTLGKSVKNTLPDLATGECWWWVPELGVLQRVKIREARTYDSSPTKKRGETRRPAKSFADVDMGAIEEKMADTIERQKQDDPKELRKRIIELEKELSQRPTQTETVEVVREVVPPQFMNKLRAWAALLRERADSVEGVSGDLGNLAAQADELGALETSAPASSPPPRSRLHSRASARPPSAPAARAASGESNMTAPQQRVLDALAWLDAIGYHQPSKHQAGMIAGYRVGKKVGGTYGNVLGQLRGAGLIDYPQAASVALTEAGRDLASYPDISPTTEGLQAAIFARLNDPERRVLQVLVDAYPDSLPKQQVGEDAGYAVGEKVGGTFGNVLGKLRSLGLIEYPSTGMAVAESVLFSAR